MQIWVTDLQRTDPIIALQLAERVTHLHVEWIKKIVEHHAVTSGNKRFGQHLAQ